ncbi:hypothetical protein HNQ59_003666 [Chitinivorax tropicus]|uniref:Uncharacterized protein n=1 Tax=Chitinivorax tropicus TaxID=714531 RepID=A0A840MT19_9PROT|nr:hypothetical protein [Chitinivorax tropicus]MBB5020347.1 hypothetical protein [Chitinivorax tropicus]
MIENHIDMTTHRHDTEQVSPATDSLALLQRRHPVQLLYLSISSSW